MAKNQDKLLSDNPKLQNLINVCAFCNKKGYKPSILETAHGLYGVAGIIKNSFEELALNDSGVCYECESLIDKNA